MEGPQRGLSGTVAKGVAAAVVLVEVVWGLVGVVVRARAARAASLVVGSMGWKSLSSAESVSWAVREGRGCGVRLPLRAPKEGPSSADENSARSGWDGQRVFDARGMVKVLRRSLRSLFMSPCSSSVRVAAEPNRQHSERC